MTRDGDIFIRNSRVDPEMLKEHGMDTVEILKRENAWVWVAVQEPGGNEQFLGQQDAKGRGSFIPVFLEKKEAQQGLEFLARDQKLKYEIQAIRYQDLAARAAENKFMVLVVDGKGRVLGEDPLDWVQIMNRDDHEDE